MDRMIGLQHVGKLPIPGRPEIKFKLKYAIDLLRRSAVPSPMGKGQHKVRAASQAYRVEVASSKLEMFAEPQEWAIQYPAST